MIEIQDITKVYNLGDVEVRALDGVSFKVDSGDWVAIMGPSGSGKSTLMNIIGCLDQPTAGSYKLDDLEVAAMNDEQLAGVRNRKIGFVFQTFNLLSRTSALANVELPLVYAGKKDRRELATAALERVGLGDRLHHRPNELSGGQQQRVAIARALINDPAIILADEPTGNLDSKSGAEIMDIFRQLHAQGMTIVMVTHDPEVGQQCKRIVRIRDGQITADERTEVLPMNLMESVRIALRSLAANKLRSSLTMLGIIIGVAAVIALMGVGRGASAAIDSQINSMGTNLLFVSPGSTSSSGVRSAQGSAQTLTYEDALALNDPDLLSAVKAVAPQVQSFGQVVYQANNTNTQIIGVTADYGPVRNYTVQDGEFITEANVQAKSSVAVLGANVASTLFGDVSPVGQTVRINNITFKVIGLLTAKGGSGMGNQDDMVVVPITTAMSRLSRNRMRRRQCHLTDQRAGGRCQADGHSHRADQHGVARAAQDPLRRRLHGAQPAGHAGIRLRDHGRVDPVPGRRGRHLAARRRHRHHEHHAGLGHRAHAGDRHPQSHRRHAQERASAIPDRGHHPERDGRADRRGRRRGHRQPDLGRVRGHHDVAAGDLHGLDLAGDDFLAVCRAVLRHLPGLPGGGTQPD